MEKIYPHNLSDSGLEAGEPRAELSRSADEILAQLDTHFQRPEDEAEIEQAPLNQLFPDATMPAKFWDTIPPQADERIRTIYRNRLQRGILTPPKIGQVLKITKSSLNQLWRSPEKQELFFNTLESYIEDKTHYRRHLGIDDFLVKYFTDKPFTLVDLGCSKGLITERLAVKFPQAKIIGVDRFFSPQFSNDKRARYITADLLNEQLPISDVDCFVCTCVWEHLAPAAVKRSLLSMANSLKDGGVIIEGVVELKDNQSGYIVIKKSDQNLQLADFIPYSKRPPRKNILNRERSISQ